MHITRTTITVLGYLSLVSLTGTAVRATRRYDHHVLGTSMEWTDPYDPRAVIHSRLQMTRDGRVLVASPRFRPGVPFTLGWFRATTASRAIVEPDVRPLPAAPRTHRPAAAVSCPGGCPPLLNVVDLYLDKRRDVLWLLDVGVVDTMTSEPKRLAPAKIVRLEIDDDDPKTYRTFDIKPADPSPTACFQYIVTFQSPAAGGGHYAFVSDAGRSAVAVLNTNTGVQWTIDFPEKPTAPDAIRDVMFVLPLKTDDGRTKLYATFLSGCRLFAINLDTIDECDESTARLPVAEVGRKPYRIVVLGSDTGSRMFFRRPAENEIWLWDVNDPFRPTAFQSVSKGRDCRAPVHVVPGYDGFVFVLKNNFADYVHNATGSLGAYTIIEPVTVLPSSLIIPNTATTAPAEVTAESCG